MTEQLNIVDLAHLELPERIVTLNDNQSLKVNGVPYNELMGLFKDNLEYLDKALQGDPDAVTSLLEEQPQKVGELIAYACGAKGNAAAIANACKMGAFHQAKIVQAMFELTFPDGEALGKFMAEVEVLLKTIAVAGVQQKVLIASGIVQPQQLDT